MKRQPSSTSSSQIRRKTPLVNNFTRQRSDSNKSDTLKKAVRSTFGHQDNLYFAMKEQPNQRNSTIRNSAATLSSKRTDSLKKPISSNHDIVSTGSWGQALSSREPAPKKPTLTAQTLKKMRQVPNNASSLHRKFVANEQRGEDQHAQTHRFSMPEEHRLVTLQRTSPLRNRRQQSLDPEQIDARVSPKVYRDYKSIEPREPHHEMHSPTFNQPEPQIDALEADVSKMRENNLHMRDLLKKTAGAVASLAKTSYLVKKQNKLDQRALAEQDMQPGGVSTQHMEQTLKIISSDINRINMLLNEVNFAMLTADDQVFRLSSSIHKMVSKDQLYQQLQSLQTKHKRLSKEYSQMQEEVYQANIGQQKASRFAKDLEDKLYLKRFQVDGLQKMLDECRQDNQYLINKVEEASKSRTSSRLAQQAQNFLVAMKSLQKLLKEGDTQDKIKDAKQRFEVCQKLLEQGIRQAGKSQMQSTEYNEEKIDKYRAQNLQLLSLIDRLKEKRDCQTQLSVQMTCNAEQITENESLQIRLDKCQAVLKAKTNQIQTQQQEITRLQQQVDGSADLTTKVDELQLKIDKDQIELIAKQDKLEEQISQNQELTTKIKELQNKNSLVNTLDSRLKRSQTELLETQQSNENLNEKLQLLNAQVLQERSNNDQLKRNLKLRYEQQLKQETDKLHQELLDLKLEFSEQLLQKQNELDKVQKNQVEQELQAINQQNSGLQKNLKSTERQLKKQKEENEQHLKQIERQEQSVKILRQQIMTMDKIRANKQSTSEDKLCLCQFPLWATYLAHSNTKYLPIHYKGLIQAIRWAHHSNTITQTKLNALQQQSYHQSKVTQQIKDDYQSEIRKVEGQLEKKELEIKEMEEVMCAKKETIEALQKEMADIKKCLNKQASELSKVASAESEANNQLKELQAKYDSLMDTKTSLERTVQEKSDEIESLKQAKDSITSKLGSQGQTSKAQLKEVLEAKATLQGQFDNLKRQIDDSEHEKENLRKEINIANQLEANLQAELDEVKKAHEIALKALEGNRDSIKMLKDTVSKGLTKQKEQASELSKMETENQQLKEQLNTLQDKTDANGNDRMIELREQFEQKTQDIREENELLKNSVAERDELMAEANRVIEEAQTELHDVKAKLKHMVQVHYHGLSYSADMSSYKGDDSSLSINVCLDQLQQLINTPSSVEVLKNLEAAKAIIGKNNQQLQKAKQIIKDQKRRLDSVAQGKDSDSDNLEAENIELLNKLQAQEVQLNQLRNQLSSKQVDDQPELKEIQTQINSLKSQLSQLLLNNVQQNAIDVFRQHFQNAVETKPSKIVQELREELLELAQQVTDLAIQKDGRTELELALDLKDMQSLRDDVQYYQAENLELGLKCKALVIRNNELVSQVKEAKETKKPKIEVEEEDKSIELSIIEAERDQENWLADSDEEQKESSYQKMGGQQSDEQTIHKLETIITEFCQKHAIQMAPAHASDLAEKLAKKCGLNVTDSDSSEESSSVLAHVKSNLLIFLKKCPIVDETAEPLLSILYSMLKLSDSEIQEIKTARDSLPVYMIDQSKTKKKMKDSFKKSESNSQASVEAIDEKVKQIKKGFTNFFTRSASSADKGKNKDLQVKAKEIKVNSLQMGLGNNASRSENLSRGSSAETGSNKGKPMKGPSTANRVDESR